jgi:hypothetical protein
MLVIPSFAAALTMLCIVLHLLLWTKQLWPGVPWPGALWRSAALNLLFFLVFVLVFVHLLADGLSVPIDEWTALKVLCIMSVMACLLLVLSFQLRTLRRMEDGRDFQDRTSVMFRDVVRLLFCLVNLLYFWRKDKFVHDSLSWMYAKDKYAVPVFYVISQLSVGHVYDSMFAQSVLQASHAAQIENIVHGRDYFLLRMLKCLFTSMIFVFEVEHDIWNRFIHAILLVGCLISTHVGFVIIAEIKRARVDGITARLWEVLIDLGMLFFAGVVFLLLQFSDIVSKPSGQHEAYPCLGNVISLFCENVVLAITIK